MAFCRNCGAEIDEKAIICPKCGVPQKDLNKSLDTFNDNGGFLWGLLGFCVPIAGLILYLVWKDSKPKTSKAAGIGALSFIGALITFYGIIFLIAMLGALCY